MTILWKIEVAKLSITQAFDKEELIEAISQHSAESVDLKDLIQSYYLITEQSLQDSEYDELVRIANDRGIIKEGELQI